MASFGGHERKESEAFFILDGTQIRFQVFFTIECHDSDEFHRKWLEICYPNSSLRNSFYVDSICTQLENQTKMINLEWKHVNVEKY